MESIVEFALYTWVAVSILAVLVQLVRILRYRMSNAAKSDARSAEAEEQQATIDLGRRMRTSSTDEQHASLEDLEQVEQRVSAVAASGAVPAPPTRPAAPPSPPADLSAPPAPPPPPPGLSVPHEPLEAAVTPPEAPAPDIPDPPEIAHEPTSQTAGPPAVVDEDPAVPATSSTGASRTLADILAGVRLPWNLLPTVDQAREPSNDRVVLLTDGVEPAEVGADVADELERLGFTITTRGEDTAIATRGDDVLGLQILPEAGAATVGAQPRFPSASPTSVALDIWIDG